MNASTSNCSKGINARLAQGETISVEKQISNEALAELQEQRAHTQFYNDSRDYYLHAPIACYGDPTQIYLA